MRYDLECFSDADALSLAEQLRTLVEGAQSRQAAVEDVVASLFSAFGMDDGRSACALVRCFQTSTYAWMPLHYRDAADHLLETLPSQPASLEQMRCLALLATRGVRAVWNDVLTSVAHQAIPLPSVEVVQQAPMIARLLDQLGMPVERAVAAPYSDEFLIEGKSSFRTFHIADAVDSPFIPAQAGFVEPFGVRSVVGMGGVLPDGELLAVILFTRVPVSHAVARRFEVVGDVLREALLPFEADRTFRRDDA